MARYDGSPTPPASPPGAPAANPDTSLVSGQDAADFFGIPLSYSTGFGGSAMFSPAGVGAGESPPTGPPLAEVIVTANGTSSIPEQPVASVGVADVNLQSQWKLYSGRELLSGVSHIGSTGIDHPVMGHVTPA